MHDETSLRPDCTSYGTDGHGRDEPVLQRIPTRSCFRVSYLEESQARQLVTDSFEKGLKSSRCREGPRSMA